MCIRDGVAAVNLGLVTQQYGRIEVMMPAVAIAVQLAVQLVRVVPVSYTHLRAHETVLDLVCRLLLEKKKKRLTAIEYMLVHK